MPRLKLKQWSRIAEITGALAVVVSLIYVGIQVNDSAIAVRSASANDANVALEEWYLQVGSNPQTSELLFRGLTSPEALPSAEEFQYLMLIHAFFLGLQNSYLLAEEGAIDDELRRALNVSAAGISRLPGMARFWRQRKQYLHSGFAEWVETQAASSVEMTMDLYKEPDASVDEQE